MCIILLMKTVSNKFKLVKVSQINKKWQVQDLYLPLSLQTASEAGARTAGASCRKAGPCYLFGLRLVGPKNEDLTTSQSPSISHPRPGSRAGSWEPWSQAGSFGFCFSLRSCESLFVCNDWKNKIAVTNNKNEFFPKGECLLRRGFPMSYWQKPPEQTKATDGWMDGWMASIRELGQYHTNCEGKSWSTEWLMCFHYCHLKL